MHFSNLSLVRTQCVSHAQTVVAQTVIDWFRKGMFITCSFHGLIPIRVCFCQHVTARKLNKREKQIQVPSIYPRLKGRKTEVNKSIPFNYLSPKHDNTERHSCSVSICAWYWTEMVKNVYVSPSESNKPGKNKAGNQIGQRLVLHPISTQYQHNQ